MPPKSSNKKNPAASWFFCETCKVHITSKARDTHEKVCPIGENARTTAEGLPLEYIRDGALFTADILQRTFEIEELKEVSAKFVNNLVFVSEGAIRLLGLHIGEEVQIHSSNFDTPLVRSIWPTPEKFLTTVFVSSEDYEDNWKQFSGGTYKIMKIPDGTIYPARIVSLQVKCSENEHPLNAAQLQDVARVLKKDLRGLIYTCGSVISYNFFNRKLTLKVCEWENFLDDSKSEQIEELHNALEGLSLKDVRENCVDFFKVVPITRIEVDSEQSIKDSEEKSDEDAVIRKTKNDVGGLEDEMRSIEEYMNAALGLIKVPKGMQVSRAILLYGSSGCGKTLICQAMATTAQKALKSLQIIRINACEVFSKFLGETEKNLSIYFEKAYKHYPRPTLFIVEDVHSLCPKQETNDISKRVSVAFARMLDTLSSSSEGQRSFLLATTSDMDAVSPTLRRCGRLDVEIEIGAPSPKDRAAILDCALRKVSHELNATDIDEIARITHAFVGADLVNLVSHATTAVFKEKRDVLTAKDLFNALTYVKPSAMREVLIESPNVRWSDIGGQEELRLKLKQAIEWPLLYPEKFQRFGIKPPRGILMYGPPGCSKTMVAKALATESQVNFLSVKGPELFSMWVGESERAVREVFRKARQVAPAIVFFDEIDAISGERSEGGGGSDGGSSVQERVLTQLLTELDGIEVLKNVTIVAATNRPDMIDRALLRPGRIDRIVYVGLPDAKARTEIFRIKLAAMPLGEDVNLEELVKRTEGYSGAEIHAVCQEAALRTLHESLDSLFVNQRHFEYALEAVTPRTSPDLLRLYEEYASKR